MELSYTLTIRVPDEIDADTAFEIVNDASDHDTTDEAKIRRWLGGYVSDAAAGLSAYLPEGWRATVTDND